MTKQRKEFDCYCLDRLKPLTECLPITYDDGNIIRKMEYKIGLKASIKHQECFILYTESEQDLDEFIYIDTEEFYNNQERFFTQILSKQEVFEIIKKLKTINIFEFTSLLEFINIYDDFKNFVEANWDYLDMDNLIEL